jgi:hypothetical protein
MKLYEFISKQEQLQYQIVWETGTHIETLHKDGTMYLLYAINDFFVEIQYNQRTNVIIGKNEFKNGEHLDKYLNWPKE